MPSNKRVYAEYRLKPKAVGLFDVTPNMSQQLIDCYEQIRVSYNITEAEGVNLDVIGRVVVIERTGKSSVSPYDPITLTDSQYRLALNAKIQKNHNIATIDDISTALIEVVGFDEIRVVDYENMSFDVQFGRLLTDDQRYILTNYLTVLPKPAAVRFLGFNEIAFVTQYGGEGTNGSTTQYGGKSSTTDDVQYGFYFGVGSVHSGY